MDEQGRASAVWREDLAMVVRRPDAPVAPVLFLGASTETRSCFAMADPSYGTSRRARQDRPLAISALPAPRNRALRPGGQARSSRCLVPSGARFLAPSRCRWRRSPPSVLSRSQRRRACA